MFHTMIKLQFASISRKLTSLRQLFHVDQWCSPQTIPAMKGNYDMMGVPTTPTGAASQDKDGGGEVSVKEFDRAMRAAEKLPSKKERQEWKTATVGRWVMDSR